MNARKYLENIRHKMSIDIKHIEVSELKWLADCSEKLMDLLDEPKDECKHELLENLPLCVLCNKKV